MRRIQFNKHWLMCIAVAMVGVAFGIADTTQSVEGTKAITDAQVGSHVSSLEAQRRLIEAKVQDTGFRNWNAEARKSVLWPGEEIICNELRVRWEFPTTNAPESPQISAQGDSGVPGGVFVPGNTTNPDYSDISPESNQQQTNSHGTHGRLVILGEGGPLISIKLPLQSDAIGSAQPLPGIPGMEEPTVQPHMVLPKAYFFAQNTVLYLEPEPHDRPTKVSVAYFRQPSVISLDGRVDKGAVFVSQLSPLTINNTRLSISRDKRQYPDGSRYNELYIEDGDSGSSVSMPVTKGAVQNIGRFTFTIARYDSPTMTAWIEVEAAEDYTTNGLQTVLKVGIPILQGETYGKFFERLAKEYGFSVTWRDAEGYPGSAEVARNSDWELPSLYPQIERSPFGTLITTLQGKLSSGHWTYGPPLVMRSGAANELIVSPSPKRIELMQTAETIAREREQLPAIFAKDYTASTKIYPVETRSAVTAKTLIEQELKTYLLTESTDKDKLPRNRQVLHRGLQLEISAVTDASEVAGVTTTTKEYVVLDADAGVFIANAIPATHTKIAEILQNVQSLVSQSSPVSAPTKSYRVDLVLLEGVKSGTKLTSGTVDPAQHGLTVDDLKLFGFDSVIQLGTGVVNMVAQAGDTGKATVMLSDMYSAELEVTDYRKPYVIMRGKLEGVEMPAGGNLKVSRTLLENTLYLEPGKPTLLGLTNFKQALILIIRVRE